VSARGGIFVLVACLAPSPVAAGGPADGGALDRPFESPWETRSFKTGAEKTANTCRELLALPPGFEPQSETDYRAFLHTRVRCRAIEALAAARAARADHLGSFLLDDAGLAELPATLMPILGPRKQIDRIAKLSAAGKTWTDVERGVRITNTEGGITFVEGKESRASLEILGRGDVDGDGVGDLLLLRAGGGKGGTASVTDVFVLTRRNAGARLEVIRRIGGR
jgi:hypothetical protein